MAPLRQWLYVVATARTGDGDLPCFPGPLPSCAAPAANARARPATRSGLVSLLALCAVQLAVFAFGVFAREQPLVSSRSNEKTPALISLYVAAEPSQVAFRAGGLGDRARRSEALRAEPVSVRELVAYMAGEAAASLSAAEEVQRRWHELSRSDRRLLEHLEANLPGAAGGASDESLILRSTLPAVDARIEGLTARAAQAADRIGPVPENSALPERELLSTLLGTQAALDRTLDLLRYRQTLLGLLLIRQKPDPALDRLSDEHDRFAAALAPVLADLELQRVRRLAAAVVAAQSAVDSEVVPQVKANEGLRAALLHAEASAGDADMRVRAMLRSVRSLVEDRARMLAPYAPRPAQAPAGSAADVWQRWRVDESAKIPLHWEWNALGDALGRSLTERSALVAGLSAGLRQRNELLQSLPGLGAGPALHDKTGIGAALAMQDVLLESFDKSAGGATGAERGPLIEQIVRLELRIAVGLPRTLRAQSQPATYSATELAASETRIDRLRRLMASQAEALHNLAALAEREDRQWQEFDRLVAKALHARVGAWRETARQLEVGRDNLVDAAPPAEIGALKREFLAVAHDRLRASEAEAEDWDRRENALRQDPAARIIYGQDRYLGWTRNLPQLDHFAYLLRETAQQEALRESMRVATSAAANASARGAAVVDLVSRLSLPWDVLRDAGHFTLITQIGGRLLALPDFDRQGARLRLGPQAALSGFVRTGLEGDDITMASALRVGFFDQFRGYDINRFADNFGNRLCGQIAHKNAVTYGVLIVAGLGGAAVAAAASVPAAAVGSAVVGGVAVAGGLQLAADWIVAAGHAHVDTANIGPIDAAQRHVDVERAERYYNLASIVTGAGQAYRQYSAARAAAQAVARAEAGAAGLERAMGEAVDRAAQEFGAGQPARDAAQELRRLASRQLDPGLNDLEAFSRLSDQAAGLEELAASALQRSEAELGRAANALNQARERLQQASETLARTPGLQTAIARGSDQAVDLVGGIAGSAATGAGMSAPEPNLAGGSPCPPGQMLRPTGGCAGEKDVLNELTSLAHAAEKAEPAKATQVKGPVVSKDGDKPQTPIDPKTPEQAAGDGMAGGFSGIESARDKGSGDGGDAALREFAEREKRRSGDVGSRGFATGLGAYGGSKFGSDSLQHETQKSFGGGFAGETGQAGAGGAGTGTPSAVAGATGLVSSVKETGPSTQKPGDPYKSGSGTQQGAAWSRPAHWPKPLPLPSADSKKFQPYIVEKVSEWVDGRSGKHCIVVSYDQQSLAGSELAARQSAWAAEERTFVSALPAGARTMVESKYPGLKGMLADMRAASAFVNLKPDPSYGRNMPGSLGECR